MAQSVMNEHKEPVIYLAPTNQLIDQTIAKGREYGIPCVVYEKGHDFPDEFLTGKSVLVCSYQALFNGRSRFGVRGSNLRDVINAAAIILDDAHVSFSTIRDSFTLRVTTNEFPDDYEHLTNLFRNDFKEAGKLGTFDDIVNGIEIGVLEVPYWGWQQKQNQIREFLRNNDADEKYPFVWPFLRDNFNYCHCLISGSAFVITPIFPLVDMIPTFAECPRRIYMSATISDDSSIVYTFDTDYTTISKPITSDSLAGVSERMILAPELMDLKVDDLNDMLRKLVNWAATKEKVGTVILTPAGYAAEKWNGVATYADTTEKVANCIEQLQKGQSLGPFVFANRYDGIDLPGDTCRILIMSGLPRGTSEYELHRANTLSGGAAINSGLAQRIEQGIGRAARGSGDYCVVIITGKDLIAWIGRSANLRFLTSSTRAQLEMGSEISKAVSSKTDFLNTIKLCLNRDKEWTEYHAETLADLAEQTELNKRTLKQASVERKAFQLFKDGYYEQAISKLNKLCEEESKLDKKIKGWIIQFSALIAWCWGDKELSQKLQQYAYAENRNLIRPQVMLPYEPLKEPGRQAEQIVSQIAQYNPRRGFIAHFDEVVSHLVPEASANQFEQSLAELGKMLGFQTERPDKTYGQGPDVLWLLNDRLGLVIEAKSRKNKKNALTKEQHGQLLNAVEWFIQEYPDYSHIRVSVHPNVNVTKSTIPGDTKALTIDNLNEIITKARQLFTELCDSPLKHKELVARCEKKLLFHELKPDELIKKYMVSFNIQ